MDFIPVPIKKGVYNILNLYRMVAKINKKSMGREKGRRLLPPLFSPYHLTLCFLPWYLYVPTTGDDCNP